jgi:hypothetical protein
MKEVLHIWKLKSYGRKQAGKIVKRKAAGQGPLPIGEALYYFQISSLNTNS